MTSIADYAAGRLAELADPEKAPGMAAYMKTTDPFYGVQKKGRVVVLRELLERFPPGSAGEYEGAILALWARPHREEKYLALDYAAAYPEFIAFAAMPLFRRLIVGRSLVGLRRPARDPLRRRGLETGAPGDHRADASVGSRRDDMWLRRTALIGQLKHREETDAKLLFDFCDRRATKRSSSSARPSEWALREYARTAPAAVTDYLVSRRDRLSGLSFREGAKHTGHSLTTRSPGAPRLHTLAR